MNGEKWRNDTGTPHQHFGQRGSGSTLQTAQGQRAHTHIPPTPYPSRETRVASDCVAIAFGGKKGMVMYLQGPSLACRTPLPPAQISSPTAEAPSTIAVASVATTGGSGGRGLQRGCPQQGTTLIANASPEFMANNCCLAAAPPACSAAAIRRWWRPRLSGLSGRRTRSATSRWHGADRRPLRC